MRKAEFHIVLLSFLVWNSALGQKYINYTVADGLPSNHVYRLDQDSQGFIWMVTDKGMVKYNGNDFKIFTTRQGLPTNDIWEIRTTPDGRVWYFAKSPRLGYIENDNVYAFPSSEKDDILYPTRQSQSGNNIYVGSEGVSYALNEKQQWQPITGKNERSKPLQGGVLIHDRVSAIYTNEALDSVFVMGHNNNLLKSLSRHNTRIGVRGQVQLNDSLVSWVDTSGFTVCNLNNLEFVSRSFREEFNMVSLKFPRLVEVNDVFMVTGESFLGILNSNFRIRESYRFPAELKVHSAMMDRDETIWMASFANGVYKVPKSVRTIKYHLPNEKVTRMNRVDGKLMAGVYDRGFFAYDTTKHEFVPVFEEKGHIYSTFDIDSLRTSFYISGKKIVRQVKGFNPSILDFKKVNLVGNSLGRTMVYHHGYLYGNFSAGVNKLDPETLEVLEFYPYVGVQALTSFKNNMYLGTPNGLRRIRDTVLEPVYFENDSLLKPVLGLQPINKEKLLITTDGHGAYVTDTKEIVLLEGTDFLNIPDAYIDNDAIWLGTDQGVYQYRLDGDNYKLLKVIRETDGLPTRNINAIYAIQDSIAVATDNGIAIFPQSISNIRVLQDLYFEKTTYDGQELFSDSSEFVFRGNSSLNVDVNYIDFSESLEDLSYQYQLRPSQKNWTTTTSRSLNFSGLVPNEYELAIRADTYERSIHFTIKPLWWQRREVQLIGWLVLFALMLSVLYLFRKHEIRKKTAKIDAQKKLAEFELYALRSQMNPHFVFNSLSAIQYCINNNDVGTAEVYLVKFSKLVRQFFAISKEKEVTISEETELLRMYLDMEKLRFREKMNYTIDIAPEIRTEEEKIPTMLLQPIVENAVNHGIFNLKNDGKIEIAFEHNSDGLGVTIKDDGVGFANAKRHHNGKQRSSDVLRDRVRFLNASGKWNIRYFNKEAFPDRDSKGNITTFIINQLR